MTLSSDSPAPRLGWKGVFISTMHLPSVWTQFACKPDLHGNSRHDVGLLLALGAAILASSAATCRGADAIACEELTPGSQVQVQRLVTRSASQVSSATPGSPNKDLRAGDMEKIVCRSEKDFTNQAVRYVLDSIAEKQRDLGDRSFILGVVGTNGRVRRQRAAALFSGLAECERDDIDWNRVVVFLADERFGADPASVESNIGLLRSSLIKTLAKRGINFPESNLISPDLSISDADECASEYGHRIQALFKEQLADGPHLMTLGLAPDGSIASIFPEWYLAEEGRWEDCIQRSFNAMHTTTSTHHYTDRICVNLHVLRKAEKLILYLGNQQTQQQWDDISERHGKNKRIVRQNTREFLTEQPSSPLEWLLKHNRVTVMKLDIDQDTQNTFVLVGACGDLARKKTFPALYGLHLGQHLSTSQKIFGCDSSLYHPDVTSSEELWERRVRTHCSKVSGSSEEDLGGFQERVEFVNLNLTDPETWKELNARIQENVGNQSTDNRIFYLALPPFLFEEAVKHIKTHCYSASGHTRVIVEKPFGNNLAEAIDLSDKLSAYLTEQEIYRIDHYLAKALVLNMLALRFANREIGRLFHTDCVANVRITFKEDFGCEGRAGYFNEYGIIRDIMQNHLMQVLSLVAMEAPASLKPEDVRDEKVKVLKQIRPVDPDNHCVIGQYEGYQEDPQIVKVNEKKGFASRTPTFATMVFYIDNERWSNVPFIMKAGKALEAGQTILRIQFKKAPPCSLFGEQPQNELVIRIQPNERIYWKLLAKMPGLSQGDQDVQQTVLDLDIKGRSGTLHIPEAYEKLIFDVMQGQAHNFVRRDELEEAWRIFDPVIRQMEEVEKRIPDTYERGSRGPARADELINSLGFLRYTVSGVSGYADADTD